MAEDFLQESKDMNDRCGDTEEIGKKAVAQLIFSLLASEMCRAT